MDELNENVKPVSWVDELSELIAKKRAENELLKKFREAVCNTEGGQPETPGADVGTMKGMDNHNPSINQKPKQ